MSQSPPPPVSPRPTPLPGHSARQFHQVQGAFPMTHGELDSPTLAFETWGQLNEAGDNGILIFTGLSPSAHVCSSPADPSPGWWEAMVGAELPIDTNRYFVVCVNSLGSCFGSTGPASVETATGEPYRLRFPVLTLEDVARASHAVVTSLGIESLSAVVGASMGGMTALAYAVLFPGMGRRLVTISAAARSHPFSIALRSLQREIIRKDPTWNGGNYAAPPATGMVLARKLGMITYRSAQEWENRFGRERTGSSPAGDPFGIDFEVESYLDNNARKFVDSFDANCYLYLSRAMDLFDVADHGASVDAALARAHVEKALVVGVTTDFLFPVAQQQDLAESLRRTGCSVDFNALPSIQGHDAFLVDMDRFRPVIAEFFQSPD